MCAKKQTKKICYSAVIVYSRVALQSITPETVSIWELSLKFRLVSYWLIHNFANLIQFFALCEKKILLKLLPAVARLQEYSNILLDVDSYLLSLLHRKRKLCLTEESRDNFPFKMLKVVEKIQVKTISVQWFQTFFDYVLIELSYFIIFYRKLVLGGQINSFAIDVIINILCDKCQIVSVCLKILLFHAIF